MLVKLTPGRNKSDIKWQDKKMVAPILGQDVRIGQESIV